MNEIVDKIDAQLEDLFNGWNIYTTAIAIVLVLYSIYPLLTHQDPDTHPFLLSRQSNSASIRQPGESAAFRSLEVPHGYPLKSGLNVKEPGTSKWAGGKDGDIRDVWRKAIDETQSGKILTIRGKDEVVEHDMAELSKHINAIGTSIHGLKGTRVAIYLPNSIEFLCSIFAAAFYGFIPILIPYHTPSDVVINYLLKTKADFLIAEAGSLPLAGIKQNCPAIHGVKWVVPITSREIDWSEDVNGVNVLTWHEVVEKHQTSGSLELPANMEREEPADLVFIWQSKDGPSEIQFTQRNIISAIASLSSALPNQHRLSHSDLLLPADSLSHPYVLCLTLAALFSNSSVALNSQAGPSIDIPLVCRNVCPTIIVTSPESALKLLKAAKALTTAIFQKFTIYRRRKSLAEGIMPASKTSAEIFTSTSGTKGPSQSSTKLRLMYISERAGAQDAPLSSSELDDLRAFTGARVVYALTAPYVAGAVCQTGFYDYRVDKTRPRSHFGPPLSSVEVKLLDKGQWITSDDGSKVEGQILVKGPAVLGEKEVNLGILGSFGTDGTLSYIQ